MQVQRNTWNGRCRFNMSTIANKIPLGSAKRKAEAIAKRTWPNKKLIYVGLAANLICFREEGNTNGTLKFPARLLQTEPDPIVDGDVRNPFKDVTMRKEYTGAMLAYQLRSQDLFDQATGIKRSTGSSFSSTFWAGFEGKEAVGGINFTRPDSRKLISWAWYRAGKDAAKLENLTKLS